MNAGWVVAATFACPLFVLGAGILRPRLAGPVAALLSALSTLLVLAAWWSGAPPVRAAWVPTWGVELHLALDGLAALFALLATSVGFLVVTFSIGYMPHHVRSERGLVRFFFLMTLFLAAMVGLACSQDFYSLLICWDLTAITSYLLIASDAESPEARSAARLALVVTGGSAVLLVLAAVALHVQTGTADLPALFGRLPEGRALLGPALLMACAALAKSAQVPAHFWLPRAMVAPTPVSAYLHSAAMVAAGVFLLARLYPFVHASVPALELLAWIGLASIATGSVLALVEDDIKAVLAYSTVAQYGYVVWLLGLGGGEGLTAAAFYVGAHGLAKSGLFLTAGCITEAAGGERRLSHLGGLASRMPLLAVASATCAAALTALPLTLGFFKDELFFRSALQHGPMAAGAAVAAAAMTFAYTWRLWTRVFLGRARREPHEVSWWLPAPVAVLATLLVAGGLAPGAYTALAEEAGRVMHGAPAPVETAYHADLRPTNVMAVIAWSAGIALFVVARRGWHPGMRLVRVGKLVGPARLYSLGGATLMRASDWLHGVEVRDLRDRAGAVLVPGGALVGAALWLGPGPAGFQVGQIELEDLPLAAMLLLAVVAAAAASQPRRHLPTLLSLSLASYSLALAFAAFGAPNVALVALLVQTVFTLLLAAMLSLFGREELHEAARADRTRAPRTLAYTAIATAGAFAFAWTTLSWTAQPVTSYAYVRRALDAHAGDVVTAILADFRALDTLGEATVLGIALLGVATILHGLRSRSR